ncbi:MAG TPA: amidohydrolase family protein [Ramlibacter sp.]|uniref:amidohydrolase family protein n=1 Tax=Ramlibacter sp. TaxID=1917967 RepID=UPI002B5DC5A1|nr:amidohydrolase family protein [Ramlibacter sp.]HVZ45173.1 amidohydrolase family protein [Ramlibacter sp.]
MLREPPLLLLRAAEVFAPEALGAQDVLVGGGRILAVGRDLDARDWGALVRVETVPHAKLVPGFIDQHVHFLGGGDGDGARMPELAAQAFASAGITTAVGLLGSDIETKTLPQLLRKAVELDREGLDARIYTGAMALPAPYITTSPRADIVLIDRVIGAKSAIGERTVPNLDFPALAQLAGSLVQAKGMSGKAAPLHLHVGRMKEGMQALFDLVDKLDFAPAQAVPSHVNRAPDRFPVFEQGLRFAKLGGNIDFTCCLGPRNHLPVGLDPVEAVMRALDAGVPAERISLSSDAGVAVPDGRGGAEAVPPAILYRDVLRLVQEARLGWPEALAFVTTHVARMLGLAATKGAIAPGMDADLVLIGEDHRIVRTLRAGRTVFDAATSHVTAH